MLPENPSAISRRRRNGRCREATRLAVLCVGLLSVLGLLASCASREAVRSGDETTSAAITSVLFIDTDSDVGVRYAEYLEDREVSRFRNYFQNYSSRPTIASRIVRKSLRTIASEVTGLSNPTGSGLVDEYREDIEKVKAGYEDFEEIAEDLGMKRGELLAGAGAAAGAAITTIGGLHLLKPRAVLGRIPWTSFEAGYDLKRIDDPRLIVRAGDDVDFVLSKDGLSGAMRDENLIYQLNLDIQRQRATANLSFQKGFSLGSRLSLKDESLTGFVNIGL